MPLGQHHNGIFRIDQRRRLLAEIEDVPPSSFGFAVAVHPHDPDTAWFVPGISDQKRIPVEGRVVVTRTRDGGRTFDVLDAGLPEGTPTTSPTDTRSTSTTEASALAFGSTTGSLWVSDDQGDTWQSTSEHLPPVYCVRFAA